MEKLDTFLIEHQKTENTICRSMRPRPGEYLLVVHLCIFNSRGEMLIQKRQMHKDRYPGLWDLSAGGFVQSGEDAISAICREAREELGVSLEANAIRYIMTIPFSYVLDDLFCVQVDLDLKQLTLQAEEVSEAKWISQTELLQMRDHGQFVDYDRNILAYCFSCNQQSMFP